MSITPPQFFVLAALLHAHALSRVLRGLERRGIGTHEKPRVTRLLQTHTTPGLRRIKTGLSRI
jgi:hypothetical protein